MGVFAWCMGVVYNDVLVYFRRCTGVFSPFCDHFTLRLCHNNPGLYFVCFHADKDIPGQVYSAKLFFQENVNLISVEFFLEKLILHALEQI